MMLRAAIVFVHASLIAMMTLFGSSAAWAQSYPSRPLKIEAGFPPGSTVDIVARAVAQMLNEAWGQPVIVENKPGAAGNVAAELVAKSAPDGYTLLLANNGLVIGAVSGKVSYSVQTDLRAVAQVASAPHVLVVTPSLPVNSIRQLIALARSRPGELSVASVGVGSPSHLAAVLFESMTHVKLLHIPYKGSNQVQIDLASGDVMMSFSGVPPALPLIQRHKVKPLGVTSATRSDALPSVPTFREAGLAHFDVGFWYGVVAPAGTSPDIVAKLNAEIDRGLESQDVRHRFATMSLAAVGGSPADFEAFIRSEIARWSKLAKANGLVFDQ